MVGAGAERLLGLGPERFAGIGQRRRHAEVARDAGGRLQILRHEAEGEAGANSPDSTCCFSLFSVLLLRPVRSEEHTSELQSLMRISYAVFCLKKTTFV